MIIQNGNHLKTVNVLFYVKFIYSCYLRSAICLWAYGYLGSPLVERPRDRRSIIMRVLLPLRVGFFGFVWLIDFLLILILFIFFKIWGESLFLFFFVSLFMVLLFLFIFFICLFVGFVVLLFCCFVVLFCFCFVLLFVCLLVIFFNKNIFHTSITVNKDDPFSSTLRRSLDIKAVVSYRGKCNCFIRLDS